MTASSALLAVAALATAFLQGPAATIASPSPLRWKSCPAEIGAPDLQCATLQVPLDHRDRHSRKIDIAVSRLPSQDPSKRRGVLLTNPGGPGGGSGLDFPVILRESGLPQSVRDAYDIVTFDPRGVGRSTAVDCGLTAEQVRNGYPPRYAREPADVARQARTAKAMAGRCAASSTAWLLPHTTTASTARDMDLIRRALHEPSISYLGYSYGTHLGAVYATLFPGHTDRFVLDSNLGARGYDATATRLLARGLEDRFADFAAFAAAHPEYGLGTTPDRVRATFLALAERLDEQTSQGIHGSLFRWLSHAFTYSDAQFPLLAETWQALDTGRPLPGAVVSAIGRQSSEGPSGHLAVLCADSRWPRSVQAYRRNIAADRVSHPMLGAAAANIGPCAFWPAEPVEPPVRVTDQGPSNVLLTQNTRDPGTPLSGARQMQQALGDRARMVTVDAGGHGVYVIGANACANDTVTRFLTTGHRPARDLTCTADGPARAGGGRRTISGELRGTEEHPRVELG